MSLGDHLVIPAGKRGSKGLGAIKSGILSRLSDDFLVKVSESLRAQMIAFSNRRRQRLGKEFGDYQFIFHLEKGYFRASVFRNSVAAMQHLRWRQLTTKSRAIKSASPKRRASHQSPWISVPKDEKGFEALAYLVGLLFGDGVAAIGLL